MDNSYFEKINFTNNRVINISKRVDRISGGQIHWHPFMEILICISESSSITVDFKDYELKQNDIAIVYSGELHTLHNDKSDSFYVIQFSSDIISFLADFGNSSLLRHHHVIRYDPTNMLCDNMIHVLKKMIALYEEQSPFYETYAYCQLLDFFIHFSHYCSRLTTQANVENAESFLNQHARSVITEACLYISRNSAQPLTVEQVAEHLNISKSYFYQLFKQYTAMTFIEYLTAERIKNSVRLLSDHRIRMIDVAYESGFTSISSFNRAFKKIHKMSPIQFREIHNNHV